MSNIASFDLFIQHSCSFTPPHTSVSSVPNTLGAEEGGGGDKKGKGRRAEEGLGSRVEGRRRREMEAICGRNGEVRGEEV